MEIKRIPTTKAELADLYSLHRAALAKLMNSKNIYFEELEKVGYEKNMVTLTPKIIRKFVELHGEPLTNEDFK